MIWESECKNSRKWKHNTNFVNSNDNSKATIAQPLFSRRPWNAIGKEKQSLNCRLVMEVNVNVMKMAVGCCNCQRETFKSRSFQEWNLRKITLYNNNLHLKKIMFKAQWKNDWKEHIRHCESLMMTIPFAFNQNATTIPFRIKIITFNHLN